MKKCGKCLIRRAEDGFCAVINDVVKVTDSACVKCATEDSIFVCELCGTATLKSSAVVFVEDRTHLVCGNCAKYTSMCQTCIKVRECAFETDPSPIPFTIQKHIQTGPMVQIMEVMNPERIAITCKMGCDCWDNVNETCAERTYGNCSNYKMIWE